MKGRELCRHATSKLFDCHEFFPPVKSPLLIYACDAWIVFRSFDRFAHLMFCVREIVFFQSYRIYFYSSLVVIDVDNVYYVLVLYHQFWMYILFRALHILPLHTLLSRLNWPCYHLATHFPCLIKVGNECSYLWWDVFMLLYRLFACK